MLNCKRSNTRKHVRRRLQAESIGRPFARLHKARPKQQKRARSPGVGAPLPLLLLLPPGRAAGARREVSSS